MDPLSAVALAKTILTVTGLGGWAKKKLGDKFGTKTAETIGAIAQAAMKTSSPEAALVELRKDPAKALLLRDKLEQREHELILAGLDDVKSAREMYTEQHDMADHVARKVIRQNHLIVLLLIVANSAVALFVKESGLALALGSLISASVGALWQERQQIIGFYFGSSLSSKTKGSLIFNPVKK